MSSRSTGRARRRDADLEDLGGRTKLISRSGFPSAEFLEGALATGMVGGAIESWDRLAEEVARIA